MPRCTRRLRSIRTKCGFHKASTERLAAPGTPPPLARRGLTTFSPNNMRTALHKLALASVIALTLGLAPAWAQDDSRSDRRAVYAELRTCLSEAGEPGSPAYAECWRQFGASHDARWAKWAERGDRGFSGRHWRDGRRNRHGYGHHRYHHRGWIGGLVLLLAIIGGVWWWRKSSGSYQARRLLDERFARGEIDEKEYLARKAALKK